MKDSNIIKIEIIQSLIFQNVKLMSEKYKGYFKIDCDLSFRDEEDLMTIFIDKIKDEFSYNNHMLYKVYLKEKEKKVKEFIEELDKELPKYLMFSESWVDITDEYLGDNVDRKYYESCQLHYWITKDYEED